HIETRLKLRINVDPVKQTPRPRGTPPWAFCVYGDGDYAKAENVSNRDPFSLAVTIHKYFFPTYSSGLTWTPATIGFVAKAQSQRPVLFLVVGPLAASDKPLIVLPSSVVNAQRRAGPFFVSISVIPWNIHEYVPGGTFSKASRIV